MEARPSSIAAPAATAPVRPPGPALHCSAPSVRISNGDFPSRVCVRAAEDAAIMAALEGDLGRLKGFASSLLRTPYPSVTPSLGCLALACGCTFLCLD